MSSQGRLIPKNVAIAGQESEEVFEVKLPNIMRLQTTRFDPKTYEVEDPIRFVNDVYYFIYVSRKESK